MANARRLLGLGLRWLLASRRRRPQVESELRRLLFRLVAIGPGRTVAVAGAGADTAPGVRHLPLRDDTWTVVLPAEGPHPAERIELGPRAVHVLPAVAHGATGLVFTGDALVAGSGGVAAARGKLPAVHWVPREYRALRARDVLDATVPGVPILPLGRPMGRNYFHWLVESLPAVVRAEAAVPGLRVLAPTDVPGFVRRSLEVLGFDVAYDDGYHRAEEVVLVDPPVPNWPHPDDLDALVARTADALGPAPTGETPARIYVTRSGAARTLHDEAALEARLQAQGFVVFRPGRWEDDAALFRRAELVVGPHGAGLANVALAPAGARLVELSSPRFRNPVFRRLAALRGQSYAHVDLPSTDGAPDGTAADAVRAIEGIGL